MTLKSITLMPSPDVQLISYHNSYLLLLSVACFCPGSRTSYLHVSVGAPLIFSVFVVLSSKDENDACVVLSPVSSDLPSACKKYNVCEENNEIVFSKVNEIRRKILRKICRSAQRLTQYKNTKTARNA